MESSSYFATIQSILWDRVFLQLDIEWMDGLEWIGAIQITFYFNLIVFSGFNELAVGHPSINAFAVLTKACLF